MRRAAERRAEAKASIGTRVLGFPDQLFEQAGEMLVLGKHDAVKEQLRAPPDFDCRKVLDLPLAHFLGVVLDVQPAELGEWKAPGEREKARAVLDAGVAPLGAQANDAELALAHQAIRLQPWPILCTPWRESPGFSRWPGSRARSGARCPGARSRRGWGCK